MVQNPNETSDAKDRAPPVISTPESVQGLETVPGPNEIADRLEILKLQEKYVGKLAFEIAVEKAHLFKIMVDTHRYKNKELGEFADAHGTSKSDTYELYKFADYADRALASCLADEALRRHYKWQDWRVVWGKIKRDLKEQQAAEPPTDDEGDAPDAAPDPVAKITRERDDLAAQVKAATQQFRNERAAREEIVERMAQELAELRERLRNPWCVSEKTLWDVPAPTKAKATKARAAKRIQTNKPPPAGSSLEYDPSAETLGALVKRLSETEAQRE